MYGRRLLMLNVTINSNYITILKASVITSGRPSTHSKLGYLRLLLDLITIKVSSVQWALVVIEEDFIYTRVVIIIFHKWTQKKNSPKWKPCCWSSLSIQVPSIFILSITTFCDNSVVSKTLGHYRSISPQR